MPVYKKCIYIVIFVNMLNVLALKPPRTPCSDKFLYKFEKNIWFADLKIRIPNIDSGYAYLQTNFSIGLLLSENSNIGTIVLRENNSTIFEKIKNFIPLDFRVYFPYSNILPYLTALIVNGQVICTGPEVETLPRTSYFLQRTLTVINNKRNNEISRLPSINPLPLHIRNENSNRNPVNSEAQNNNFQCGIIESQNSHPWLVGLFQQKNSLYTFYCSGTLITNKHIITAAHCTSVQFTIYVKLGSNNVKTFLDAGTVSRFSENIYTHPDYDPDLHYADLSIMLLNEEVTISPNIKPICLWSKDTGKTSVIGKLLQFVGWTINNNGFSNENPTEVNVIINPLEDCDKFDDRILSPSSICASYESQTLRPCLENSGGALIFSVNNRQMLRGVISVTTIDSNPSFCNTYFSLFTDIAKYTDWINFTLRLS